jgi:multimeric flavodoxin WrbA
MKLLIHDMDKDQFETIFPNLNEDITVISNNNSIRSCNGCFGCWIKTPGKCVIQDDYKNMGEMIAGSDELIIMSKCFYGGYSPFIKNVLDRSISYVHPFFVIRNGEIHHKSRYKNKIDFKVYFYSEDITEEEMEVAKELVIANGINLNTHSPSTLFVKEPLELRGIL